MEALIQRQFDLDFVSIRTILEEDEIKSFEEAVRKIIQALIGMFREQTQLRLVIYGKAHGLSIEDARESFQRRMRHLILENFDKYSRGDYEKPTELSMYVLTTAVVGTLLAATQECVENLHKLAFEEQLTRLILGYFVPALQENTSST